MMDIIEKLRGCAYNLSLDIGSGQTNGGGWGMMMELFADSADEIERLQNNLDKALQWNAEKDLEIERLRVKAVIAGMPMSMVEAELREQLAAVTKERDTFYNEMLRYQDELATVKREMQDLNIRLGLEIGSKNDQLTAVTKERDEWKEASQINERMRIELREQLAACQKEQTK